LSQIAGVKRQQKLSRAFSPFDLINREEIAQSIEAGE
jgi:hypothetical protein